MPLSQTLKVIASPVCRQILEYLKGGRQTAGDIAAQFDLTGATISYHLSNLKKAGLIHEQRQKNYIFYELNVSVFEEILVWILQMKGETK
ncbi:MAG: autorepressor SdpR family transcription factor [Oscillospiraceae bacterium]|jgi:DNA-binding transcriptional ArsR family regulator|nr:autorepressor SdpR family transcription factor [Oscillospiraceae bacterium]